MLLGKPRAASERCKPYMTHMSMSNAANLQRCMFLLGFLFEQAQCVTNCAWTLPSRELWHEQKWSPCSHAHCAMVFRRMMARSWGARRAHACPPMNTKPIVERSGSYLCSHAQCGWHAGAGGALVGRAPGARVPKPRSPASEALAEVSKHIAQQVAALASCLTQALGLWGHGIMELGLCCRSSSLISKLLK